jgi:hypothetical protein
MEGRLVGGAGVVDALLVPLPTEAIISTVDRHLGHGNPQTKEPDHRVNRQLAGNVEDP